MQTALATALLFSLLGGLGDLKVDSWQDQAAKLENYKTYDWKETELGGWSRKQRGIRTLDDEIRDCVDKRLAAMGYVIDTQNDVDFLIAYAFIPPERQNKLHHLVRLGSVDISAEWGAKDTNLLFLEFHDLETRQPFWRGRARKVMTRKHTPAERIDLAVQEILAQYYDHSHDNSASEDED